MRRWSNPAQRLRQQQHKPPQKQRRHQQQRPPIKFDTQVRTCLENFL